MRLTCAVLLAIISSLGLIGCGGKSNSSASQSSSNLSGNWQLTASSSVAPGTVVLGGNLVQSGNNVSGVVHLSGSSCYSFDADIHVSGTVSGATATLTSQAVDLQVISVTANVPSTGNTLVGNYSIVGGCGDGDKGTLSGTKVPAFTGNWTGSFLSSTGQQVNVTAAMTQNPADAHGFFTVSGSAKFANSPCFATGTVSTSTGIGGAIVIDIATADGGTTEFIGNASNLATGSPLTGSYTVQGGSCSGDAGSGSLTRQ